MVVTCDLTPALAASLDRASVAGVADAAGAPLSHAAILVRSLGIPAVTGLGPSVLHLAEGRVVLLDGDSGTLRPDPSREERVEARARMEALARRHDDAARLASEPATTLDGHPVAVWANAGDAADVAGALTAGADGIGMLRTELTFLGRDHPPSESEHLSAYRAVAEAVGDRPLTIRTLDLGADIPVWGGAPEANPALGNRGLRLSLAAPELFDPQLRAIARIALRRRLRVMFPMVTTVDELRQARDRLDAAVAAAAADAAVGADAAGDSPADLDVGITVEVPAAALTARSFAPLVDFFAIGTNDLTQYTLAADRTNAAVAGLGDGLHPAVLRLVRDVTSAAEAYGRPVEVVGEMATDPLGVLVLLGLDVDALSVRPNSVAAVKQLVRAVDLGKARRFAGAALEAESAAAVRHMAPCR